MGRDWFSKVCQRAQTICRNSDADRLKVYVLTAEGKWRFVCYCNDSQGRARTLIDDFVENSKSGRSALTIHNGEASISLEISKFHGLAIGKSMVGQ